jgi:CrcB protein
VISRRLAAVAVGGVLGTWIRWGVTAALPVSEGSFPTATFLVNMIGAVAIGVVAVVFLDPDRPRPVGAALLGTGLLGGLTTFSAFSVEMAELSRTGHGAMAVAYVVVSVVLGVGLARVGMILTRRAVDGSRESGS